jgi:hypothetical protein
LVGRDRHLDNGIVEPQHLSDRSTDRHLAG